MRKSRSVLTLGEKIRELLLQHGDFRAVEVALTKRSEQLAQNDTKGGWYSEVMLTQKGWTELHGKCLNACEFVVFVLMFGLEYTMP